MDVSVVYILSYAVNNFIQSTTYSAIETGWKNVNNFNKMALSPDGQIILVWDDESTVKLLNPALNILHTHTPTSTPNTSCTKTISFSQDSSLAIVETDLFNPIVILNTVDLSIVHSIMALEAVDSVHFVNSSNDFIIVFQATSTFFVDLNTSKFYPLPYIPATSYTTDIGNNIFTCQNNILTQISISYST